MKVNKLRGEEVPGIDHVQWSPTHKELEHHYKQHPYNLTIKSFSVIKDEVFLKFFIKFFLSKTTIIYLLLSFDTFSHVIAPNCVLSSKSEISIATVVIARDILDVTTLT